MKVRNDNTQPGERKPGVARRGVLGAIAAGAALSATTVASNCLPTADLKTDGVLVGLWHQLLDALDALDANSASYERARANLPEWARPVDGRWLPAWSADMLTEHQIPESMGNRFHRDDLEKLNKELAEAAYSPLFAADGVPDLSAASSLASFFDRIEQKDAIRSKYANHPDIVPVRSAAKRRLAAWDARRDQQEAEEVRCGLPALSDERDALWERRDAIIDEIAATSHRSPVGMMIRLRVWLMQATDLEGDTLDDLDTRDAVVVSLVREAEATDAALLLPLPASLRKVLGGEA
ncbi:MAG: hypothetical protein ACLGJC_30490 [Alphaproteobacteria bacterium]